MRKSFRLLVVISSTSTAISLGDEYRVNSLLLPVIVVNGNPILGVLGMHIVVYLNSVGLATSDFGYILVSCANSSTKVVTEV